MLRLSLLACTSAPEPSDTEPAGTDTDAPVSYEAVAAETVTVQARDGVALVADVYLRPEADRPGIVLLHMVPPSYDRTTWPADFIAQLSEQGWSVVAIDRRGAGDSGGTARDAYEGETAWYDVEAAVSLLDGHGAGALGIIGASNGTTSLLDYAVNAPDEGLTEPVVVGLMTGGSYTENQHDMAELPELPAVFTYSTEEARWSERQQDLDPGSWRFLEYAEGDHGTKMFEAAPEVSADLVDVFAETL